MKKTYNSFWKQPNRRLLRSDVLFLLFLIFLIILVYRNVYTLFFQQDEWMSLGLVQADGIFASLKGFPLSGILGGQQRIIGTIINNAFHLFFPFQTIPFVVISISIHSLNCFLIYKICKHLFSSTFISVFASLFFAVSYLPSQSMIWYSAMITTLGSTFFGLTALWLLLEHANNHKWRILSFLAAYAALLTKESSAVFFVLLPAADLLAHGPEHWQKRLKRNGLFMLGFLFFIGLRAISFFGGENKTGVFINTDNSTFLTMVLHFFFYPILGFGQLFIAAPGYLSNIMKFQDFMYPFLKNSANHSLIAGTITSDLISVIAAAVVLFAVAVFLNIHKRVSVNNMSVIVVLILLSFIPYVVVQRSFNGLFDSRYYYLGMAGGAVVLSFLFVSSFDIIKKILPYYVCVFIMGIVFLGFLGKQYQWIQREIRSQQIVSRERVSFLSQLLDFYPSLSNNTVFYIYGDSPGMYGLADLMVPFQQGLGYTLMVLYNNTSRTIPSDFLRDSYLWNINAQGYREQNGFGFGYYWNYDDLKKDAVRYGFTPDQIAAFEYKAGPKTLINKTDSVRNELF